MPPQLREVHNNNHNNNNNNNIMNNQNNDNDDQSESTEYRNSQQVNGTGTGTSGMRRVVSESFISVQPDDVSTKGETYRIRKSSLIGMINWTHVLGADAPRFMLLGIIILLGQIIHQVVTDLELHNVPLTMDTITMVFAAIMDLFQQVYNQFFQLVQGLDLFNTTVKVTFVLLCIGAYTMGQRAPVYLLSFATFKAPDSWKLSHANIIEIMRRQKCFTEDSLDFLMRVLERSGTGQATAWPPGIVKCLHDETVEADSSIEASRAEAQTVIFDIVDQALKKAAVSPRDIDVLIVNCSLFSPTPSLCAMVLSHFNMRSDVATFNLSGMGCSASLISIDLAQQLLTSSRSKHRKALVVSTEILTPNFYHGNDRGFLIQNTLFRCGGAAIVLSNSWLDGRRAWYKLLHTVRVQGTGEAAYECVYEGEDDKGERGVRLSKDIVKVAGKCMEKNFTMLGPSVLPLTEQSYVVVSIMARYGVKFLKKIMSQYLGMEQAAKQLPTIRPYVPDFKTGIDHFCIHAGGRAVIDGIEKNLQLRPYHTEASRMTLLNYGNTSSSSIWYELEYIQQHQKTNSLKKGDRILQVAFGSGFKCTSGVWLKL